MKLRPQHGTWLLATVISAGIALQCAAQSPRADWTHSRQENKPPKEQRPNQNQQRSQEQRQERRQQPQESHRAQPERKNAEVPPRSAEAPRNPATAPPSRGTGNLRDGGNRSPNASGESVQRPNFNGNRPPNATVHPRELTPEERQRLQRNEKRFKQLPP